MNRLEHLLWILSEECAEVAQRASKAARFGMDEIQPGQPLTNEERVWEEINDLRAAIEMLAEERGYDGTDPGAVRTKKSKVDKFLEYSQQCGTLEAAGAPATTPRLRWTEDGLRGPGFRLILWPFEDEWLWSILRNNPDGKPLRDDGSVKGSSLGDARAAAVAHLVSLGVLSPNESIGVSP